MAYGLNCSVYQELLAPQGSILFSKSISWTFC